MEDRLTDQPEEVIKTCPELGQLCQSVTALENVEGVDTVTEAEDKTSGDDGRQQRCKYLSQDCSDTLQRILILLGSFLHFILRDTGDAGNCCEIIVEF